MRANVALCTFTQPNFQWLKISTKLHAMRLQEKKTVHIRISNANTFRCKCVRKCHIVFWLTIVLVLKILENKMRTHTAAQMPFQNTSLTYMTFVHSFKYIVQFYIVCKSSILFHYDKWLDGKCKFPKTCNENILFVTDQNRGGEAANKQYWWNKFIANKNVYQELDIIIRI